MIANYDWEDGFLLSEYLDLLHCEDDLFMKFICQVLHPEAISEGDFANTLADSLNIQLKNDGYEVESKRKISGRNVYSYRRFKI
jgi:hypothetical protein